jgi:NTE family protein
MKKYKTGLVLSGGGARGFAHLGVIEALAENGIRPDVISGVSAGSIVGAFIAAGKSPLEILKIFKKGGFLKYTKLHLPKNGLLKLDGLREVIESEIEANKIEELKTPLFIGISNLNTGGIEYRASGPLSLTVLASSSIPILFAPIEIDGQYFVDGGLMNNIPIAPVKDLCDELIVSNITPLLPNVTTKNLIQVASRTFHMTINANISEARESATIFVEPAGIDKYELLSSSHADELFELGYNSTQAVLGK